MVRNGCQFVTMSWSYVMLISQWCDRVESVTECWGLCHEVIMSNFCHDVMSWRFSVCDWDPGCYGVRAPAYVREYHRVNVCYCRAQSRDLWAGTELGMGKVWSLCETPIIPHLNHYPTPLRDSINHHPTPLRDSINHHPTPYRGIRIHVVVWANFSPRITIETVWLLKNSNENAIDIDKSNQIKLIQKPSRALLFNLR